MKKKKHTIPDMPSEVMWVAVMQSMPYVGMKTLEEIDRIIDKYPSWFKWEHKKKAIPQYVHEAFDREAFPDRYKPFERIDWGKHDGKGVLDQIKNEQPFDPLKPINIIKLLEEQHLIEYEREQMRIAENQRLKRIWDKHYSKYKLEYRELA